MTGTKRIGAMLACATFGFAAPALAQDGPRPFLTFQHSGLESAFVDERDMALRDALAMLPDRIAELPGEIPDMPPEAAGMLELFLRTIAKPARVAITYDGDNPVGGMYGYGFIASIQCEGEDEVEEIRDAVLGVTSMIAEEEGVEIPLEESETYEGMSEMMLPFGLLSFGPRHSDSGWRYEIMVGTMNDPDAAFQSPPRLIEEAGFESFMTATIDFSTVTPLTRMVTNMAGANAPQAAEFIARFEEMGLVGEDAISAEYQGGITPKASVQRFVIRGAKERAEALSLPTEPLTPADLTAVPADTFAVTIGKAKFDSIERTLDEMIEHGVPVEDALNEFEEMTGVNLMDDVLRALGGTVAFYNAEATGGGSLLSAVLLVAVEDHDRFAEAVESLADFANGAIDEHGEPGRYIQLDPWTDSGVDLLSLRFPGLPVPLEVTLALTDKWFIAGLTPQAAVAAARQTTGQGDKGLTANPRFASMFSEHGKGATSLSFVDTPRTLRAGYPFLALAGSAISNLVRSPQGDDRDPGMILPLYGDLANGDALPTFQVTRWEGDDMVTSTWSDRCLWVQAGGSMGVASAAIPLIAAGVGAAAAAGESMDLGALEFEDAPLALLHAARRSLLIDPLADVSAAAIAVSGAPGNGQERLRLWTTPHP